MYVYALLRRSNACRHTSQLIQKTALRTRVREAAAGEAELRYITGGHRLHKSRDTDGRCEPQAVCTRWIMHHGQMRQAGPQEGAYRMCK